MTNRVISPLKWTLLGTAVSAIGTVAAAGATQYPSQALCMVRR